MQLQGHLYHTTWIPFTKPKWSAISFPHENQCPRKSISVVTYNIWFDGLLQKERYSALLQEISKYNPDVVCLQECNHQSQKIFTENQFIQENYILSDINTSTFDCWYGITIMLRKDLNIISIEKIPFESRMGRYLAKAVIKVDGKQVSIGTSHFESGFNDLEYRKNQWEVSSANLPDASILCGDFNVHDDHIESEALFKLDWKDSWHTAEKKPKDLERDGITFGIWKGGNNRRLDRILYRGYLKPVSIQTIGDAPLEGYPSTVYISDHFGVYATFEIE
ncbi:Tyrosyl-DNA phosphodiesterase 2 [Boothiomyces macroporosus]|uniref:Tyrosyl-DNA phosphodiesterase 2 n=1 Tax=Boothiomyces macroporosus TaxID=261099 RepID=A0AAD5UF32_9FUNG|nr:Tyrosyl-DNA phosphodiesterase 2 [Boothiomyces macroporosus]